MHTHLHKALRRLLPYVEALVMLLYKLSGMWYRFTYSSYIACECFDNVVRPIILLDINQFNKSFVALVN